MKIREQEFKHLPRKKEYISLLKKLSHMKTGDNPHPYFEKLMILISQDLAIDVIPVLLPYLNELTLNNTDFSFINFLINTKIGFYHRVDISKLSNQQIKSYLKCICDIHNLFPLEIPSDAKTWHSELMSMYLWNAMLLHSFSPDALLISRNGKFERPFKVTCPHCGNDIHSLTIDIQNMENTSKITPAPKDSVPVPLFFDDLNHSFQPILEEAGEETFSKVLPLVYGTYECTKCNQTSQVMRAMKIAQLQIDPYFVPTIEFITRLGDFFRTETYQNPEEHWVSITFVVSMWRQLEGIHSLHGMIYALEVLHDNYHLLQDSSTPHVTEEVYFALSHHTPTEENLEDYIKLSILLLKLLETNTRLGLPFSAQKLQSLYQNTIQLLEEEPEQYSENLWSLKIGYAHHFASQGSGDIAPLQAIFDQFPMTSHPKQGSFLHQCMCEIYCQSKDYAQAILHKNCQLQLMSELKEASSISMAMENYLLGQLYCYYYETQSTENVLQDSFTAFETASKLLLAELGNKYALPNSLKQFATGTEKIPKDALRNPSFTKVFTITADVLTHMGNTKRALGDYAEALTLQEMTIDFWNWCYHHPEIALGQFHVQLAITHQAMGNVKSCKQHLQKAITIFQIREKQTNSPKEREDACGEREKAEARLASL